MRSFIAAATALLAVASAAPTKRENNFTGDLTYYDVGLGSCGITNGPGDAIVALAVDMMQNGANPNANPLCGQTITISYNGVQTQATIVDTCQACATDDLDASTSLFSTVAPNGDGRVHGVSWWFNSTPDGSRPS
ncbi:MAG: hypothetical protein MMC23_002138 [Stictis urceolatum]|nr:hypothetical protein [Stictis urceolata]